jgi:hypothetical protein
MAPIAAPHAMTGLILGVALLYAEGRLKHGWRPGEFHYRKGWSDMERSRTGVSLKLRWAQVDDAAFCRSSRGRRVAIRSSSVLAPGTSSGPPISMAVEAGLSCLN